MKTGAVLAGLLLAAIIVNYMLYAGTVAFDLPEGDHWRWLRNGLIPLVSGEKNFWQYITVEFVPLSHSHIPTLFEIWLNYHLFGLDYRLESWLGLAGMFATFALLCRLIWTRPGFALPAWAKVWLILVFAFLLLNQRNILSWTLVQFENLYLFAILAYLVYVDRTLAGSGSRARLLWATVAVFFLGDAVGFAAMLGVIAYLLVLMPRREGRLLLQMLAILIVGTIVSLILFRGINPLALLNRGGAGSDEPGIVTYVFTHALDFIKTVLMLLAQGLGGQQEFRFYGGDAWLVPRYITGFGIAVYMGVAALAYMHYHDRLITTALPMLMILLCLASLGGIVVTRFQAFGLDIASANRYIRLFQIGLLGATWINAALLFRLYEQSRLKIPVLAAACCFTAIAVTAYVLETHFYWRFHEAVLDNRAAMANAYREYARDDAYPVGDYHARCARHYCRDAIAWLEANELSLFANTPEPR